MARKSKKFKKNPLHSLFPYQIKDRTNFYFRDHPVIHPDSPTFDEYWMPQLKCIIEGKWVDDGGTWVYMMPKLYFYINSCIIPDEDRNPIQPRLRDNEWIIFTYLLCVNGFMGFELDEEFTCDIRVGILQGKVDLDKPEDKRRKLTKTQISKIPETSKKKDGSYKNYIHAWTYLTEHYLITNKKDYPLGQPIYGALWDGVILSARTLGKSFSVFIGDFLHEFLTGGIKNMDDIHLINKRLLFGAGCKDSRQLQRSINNVKAIYDHMPGKYRFKPVGGKEVPPYMGPMYKKLQGSWEVGGELNHIVKNKQGNTEIQGSSAQFVALTKDRRKVGAGDRFRRIYIEEFGFQDDAIEVHKVNKDSLRVGRKKVGSWMGLGTAGDMLSIKQPRKIFEDPRGYGIFGIPNFWENPKKQVGLFISRLYADEDYKDENGNTKLEESLEAEMMEREFLKENSDSVSYDSHIQFNPIIPTEMLRVNARSMLPKQEAQDQVNMMNNYDLFQARAIIGKLVYDVTYPRGIRFDKDLSRKLRPILEWKGDSDDFPDKEGAFIMYEQPLEEPPEGLYWVIYDPTKQSGDGESFHSVIVYKYFYSGNSETMYDTIVATWIGRKELLDDNYEMVIKIAKFFNARIFPEINVAGFVEWCSRNNHYEMLEGDAQHLEKEISPNSKRSWYKVGFRMTPRAMVWCMKRLHNWLVTPKQIDPVTNVPKSRTINWIFDPRILDEIINHNGDDNFDMISSLLGLMLLLGKLDGEDIPNVDGERPEEDYLREYNELLDGIRNDFRRKERAKFLQY